MGDEVAREPRPIRGQLREVALFFLRLGFTAFGGPAAHIALMEQVVVRERRWLTREKFLDLLGAANLIPGPSSTELAIYIGYERAGAAGLVAAGVCFILPAALITLGFAWAYVRMGRLPQAAGVLYGIKPVIIAVVAQALWSLSRTAVKSRLVAGVGLASLAAALLRLDQLVILAAAGLLVMALRSGPRSRPSAGQLIVASAPVATAAAVAGPVGLLPLFLVFAKTGAVLFGSGYVLLAFLREDLVHRLHWLTEAQLLDAIAVGQFTPGPVFTTATFIGYLLSGIPGAVAATVGIFAPAFVLVASSSRIVPRVRRSEAAGAFLDGVNVASLALMAAVSWDLGRAALVDLPTVLLGLVSALLLLRLRVNAAWLVVAGGLAGFILKGGVAS
jgi:chromate transporter